MTAQLRRSAVSVPSNIAEGRGRQGIPPFLYHLSVANGSLMELETQLLIGARLTYLMPKEEERVLMLLGEVRRLLAGLIRGLKRAQSARPIADSR